jgi:hypothetical protein
LLLMGALTQQRLLHVPQPLELLLALCDHLQPPMMSGHRHPRRLHMHASLLASSMPPWTSYWLCCVSCRTPQGIDRRWVRWWQ